VRTTKLLNLEKKVRMYLPVFVLNVSACSQANVHGKCVSELSPTPINIDTMAEHMYLWSGFKYGEVLLEMFIKFKDSRHVTTPTIAG